MTTPEPPLKLQLRYQHDKRFYDLTNYVRQLLHAATAEDIGDAITIAVYLAQHDRRTDRPTTATDDVCSKVQLDARWPF